MTIGLGTGAILLLVIGLLGAGRRGNPRLRTPALVAITGAIAVVVMYLAATTYAGFLDKLITP